MLRTSQLEPIEANNSATAIQALHACTVAVPITFYSSALTWKSDAGAEDLDDVERFFDDRHSQKIFFPVLSRIFGDCDVVVVVVDVGRRRRWHVEYDGACDGKIWN